MPLKVGVVSLVRLSVSERPLSEAASRSGAEGTAGAEESMVMERAAEASETLPARSVCVAVRLWTPSPKALGVKLQLPEPSAMAVPIDAPPSYTVTVAFASVVPLRVGIVLLVTLSLLEIPESEAVVRSGTEGALGAVVSITSVMWPANEPVGTLRLAA